MRVCFVCGNIYPLLARRTDIPIVGGAEVQQYLVGKELSQRQMEIRYVTEDFGQGVETTQNGFRVLAYKYGRNKARQGLTLWRALQRADADIYYVRGMPKFGILIYAFCRLHGRRIVQALADDFEAHPELCPGMGRRWIYKLHTAWRANADLVLAQNRYQAKHLERRWGIQSFVVPNVVPVAANPKSVRAAGKLTVLWVGAISPEKRVELLADIAGQLPDVDFTVVGGAIRGRENYYEQAQARVTKQANVRWLGYVPYHRVRDRFRKADILLHTGNGRMEGFPNVFLQSWAEGIPVVSMGADPDQLIADRGLGVYCPSLEEAVGALRQLSLNRSLLKDIGSRAWKYVSAVHTFDAVIPQYVVLFRQLLEED